MKLVALFFAIGGTVVCAATVALVLIAVSGAGPIPFISEGSAWMFGSLIAAVDPVAIGQVYEVLHVDHRLHALAGAESLLNDAAAIVLFRIALEFTDSCISNDNCIAPSFSAAVVKFARLGFGSTLIGMVVGCFAAVAARLLPPRGPASSDSNRLSAMWLLLVYASYLLGEVMHCSGIVTTLSCVCCIRLYARYSIGGLAYQKMLSHLAFIASQAMSLMFLYLGNACVTFSNHFSLSFVALTVVLVIVARIAFAVPFFAAANALLPIAERIPGSHIAMLCFGGLRGPIAVMLAMEVTSAERSLIISATCSIALLTVAVLGGLCPTVIDKLGVLRGEKADRHHAEAEAKSSKATPCAAIAQMMHGVLFKLLVSMEGKEEREVENQKTSARRASHSSLANAHDITTSSDARGNHANAKIFV